MSTRSGRRSGKSKGSARSGDWSEWIWDEKGWRWYRARLNSRGEYDYQYQLGQNAAQDSTPRGATTTENVSVLPSIPTSYNREYYDNQDYDYQYPSQTSGEVNDLSREFAKTSLNDERLPSTDSASYGGYQSNEGQQERTSTHPITIPSNPWRQADDATSKDYSSSSHSTVVGRQSGFPCGKPPSPPSGYTAPSSSSYYAPVPEQFGSTYSVSASYDYPGPSMVDSQGIPISSIGYSNPSQGYPKSGYSEPAPGYSNPAQGYPESSRSYVNSQSETQSAHGASAATSSGAITPKPTHKTITGTPGAKEKLDPNYKVHKSTYFTPGQVFKVLWFEPLGENARQTSATEVTDFSWDVGDGRFAERAHSTIRRFVIVAADYGHCQCLPILTYHRQGTTKPGVKREDHAIIYTGDRPPRGIEGEDQLKLRPIRVIPKTPRDKLEKESRINYAKIYTVEHNVKVHFIGYVDPTFQHKLVADFDATWMKKRQMSPWPQGNSASNTAESSLYMGGGYK
ncbi:hypothetical protein F5882DRAFT_493290 [Hyaloscypha sp. PMI_1271]|nr:hypothetical protein F5882DRAFT_493290 [Hyaloscypha sp. PMI_1271]